MYSLMANLKTMVFLLKAMNGSVMHYCDGSPEDRLLTRRPKLLDGALEDHVLGCAAPENCVLLYDGSPEYHILLDGIHPVLELCPGGVHLGDHGADVAHDGGEH